MLSGVKVVHKIRLLSAVAAAALDLALAPVAFLGGSLTDPARKREGILTSAGPGAAPA